MSVKVRLQPIVGNINLPTVLKTTILPGDEVERLFIATQVGEIFYTGDERLELFLDIRSKIIELGANGGYDERGLLGLAFHPDFYYNGLFYLHYSVAGSQGAGALSGPFNPDPCNPETLNMIWTDRENQYDHIDTVEEWVLPSYGQPQRRRSLLNIRRPFMNHNGVNSLNFSPESGNLILTTGDGGSGYDPFNLAQNVMEIAGKIIGIDIDIIINIGNLPAVTRFEELPEQILETLTVIAKGVRNIPGISYQKYFNQYIKYVGIVGQDLVESIYSFTNYKPISAVNLILGSFMNSENNMEGLINFGWRGWEGDIPTPIFRDCSTNQDLEEKIIAYYDEAVKTSVQRIPPLVCYYHDEPRPDKLGGTALTGVQAYMGMDIPDLTGSVVFTDFVRYEGLKPPILGILAYARIGNDCKLSDYNIIETDYNFGSEAAYFVTLGTNRNQTRLYLGVYGSSNVADYNQGTIFEIIP